MKRNRIYANTLSYCLLGILALFTVCAYFVAGWLFYLGVALTVLALVLIVVFTLRAQFVFKRYLTKIAARLNGENRQALERFPLPTVAANADGAIVWYNTAFREQVLQGNDIYGVSLTQLIDGYTVDEIYKKKALDADYAGKKYNVYVSAAESQDAEHAVLLYFADNTRLKQIAEEYVASRPVVLSVFIDNLEELSTTVRDRERMQLAGEVEVLLENWLGKDTAVLQKYDSDRFLIMTEKRHLDAMIQERFRILDSVRGMPCGVHSHITLSIGVGQGETMAAAATRAAQALEMALGRGGDQAAVKTKNGFDFYGGISKGVERRTKVRTRMVASAMNKLIQNSSEVLVMGHAFSDMDSIGSGAALAMLARKRGKVAYVVLDEEKTLASEMVNYLRKIDDTLFLNPADAEQLVDENTLVIVTDTHHPERVDAPRVLQKAKVVAVVDHHRRMVNGIEDAVLFYHEPSASSASEMVAELAQYMGEPALGKAEAEVLLAGIILDTRNFVLKAGARTFEAAAYLRRVGADTVKVQSLFAAGMELYRKKMELVSCAFVYRDMAISKDVGDDSDSRIAASQAANELLTIQGIRASFVLLESNQGVNVSARSLGDVNVQLIMEALNGGGHLTMAGAFLRSVDTETAIAQLKTAIDEYLKNTQQ